MKVTIFGSSSEKIDKLFLEDAYQLGQLIAEQGWVQYNGAGKYGVMGAATRGGLNAKGEVHGIIIDVYKEHQADGLSSCVSYEEFHHRKQGLIDAADVIVAVAGGIGTLSEIFHVLDDWLAELSRGKTVTPLILLNTNNFFLPLYEWIETAIVQGGFLQAKLWRQIICVVDKPVDVIARIKQFKNL